MNSTNCRLFELCLAIAVAAGVAIVGASGCGDDTSGSTVAVALDASVDVVVSDAPACPATCDDQSDCTVDSCDPVTLHCVHSPAPIGTECNAHDPCTTGDKCDGAGLCLSGPRKTCKALDQCHVAGTCQQSTGECSQPNAPNGRACNDGLMCTTGDQCVGGVCTGTPVVCAGGATCELTTGSCPNGFPNSVSARVFENAWGPSRGNGLIRGADGRIFTAGYYSRTTDLGSGPVTTDAAGASSLDTDIFLAQIDPGTETAMWTQSFHGAYRQDVAAFAIAGEGQLGMVGPYTGFMTVGSTDLDLYYEGDQYILGASSANGAGLWARRVNLQGKTSMPVSNGLYGIAGDPNAGVFFVCGTSTKDGSDFSASLKGAWKGGQDVVLAALDAATGGTLWASQVGGPNDEDCAGIATDSQSNLYVMGSYRFGSIPNFGSPVALPMLTDTRSSWLFLAKLDGKGGGVWAIQLGNNQQKVTPTAMLVAGSDVFVAGTVAASQLSLNGVDLGGSSTFLARIDGSTGNLLWIEGLGAGGGMAITAMTEGSAGEILVTGKYYLLTTLGAVPLPTPNIQGGLFVARVGDDGKVLAARGYGDPSSASSPAGVIVRTDGVGAEAGSSLLLGFFGTTMNLGPDVGLLTNSSTSIASPSALFLARLAP